MDALQSFGRRLMGSQVVPLRQRPGQTLGVRWQALSPAEQYRMLRQYRDSNNLYSAVAESYRLASPQAWQEALRPLRNPTMRIVEAYVSTVWAGPLDVALPIETENEAIIEPIQQVWRWSNWGSQKQVTMRLLAMLGDCFLKVVQRQDTAGRPDRVFFQIIDPEWVTDFSTDNRGYLTYVRIDVPQSERNGDTLTEYTYTEVWDKERFRQWKHTKMDGTDLRLLGTPERDEPLSAFGIGFVPIVHLMFRDVGQDRGEAAIVPVIDKIDEINRLVTRIHQQLYRYGNVTHALKANQIDAAGRPMPAPALEGDDDGTITLGESTLLRLPGNSSLELLVPNLPYDQMLNVAKAMEAELERDAPAMAYSRVRELGAMSGVAIRYLLTDFVQSVEEVRGNVYDALARADAMALTIGQVSGLFGRELGSYDAGAFEHTFAGPPVIPLSDVEVAQVRLARAQAMGAEVTAGVSLEQVLRDSDYPDEAISLMVAQKEQARAAMATALAKRPVAAPFGQDDTEPEDA